MYPNLKLEIFKLGLRQNHLAKELGMDDTVLSKIIHGYREPTDVQRRALASYLRAEEGWLFEKFDTSSAARKSPLIEQELLGSRNENK